MTAPPRPLILGSAVTVVMLLSAATWVCFLGWSDDHPVLSWWQRAGALCTITAATAVGVRWLGPWWAWLCTAAPLAAVGAYFTFHADVLGSVGAVVWVVYALCGTGVIIAAVTGLRWIIDVFRRRVAASQVPSS